MSQEEQQLREAFREIVETWEKEWSVWIEYAFSSNENRDLHQALTRARQMMHASSPNTETERSKRARCFVVSLSTYKERLQWLEEEFGLALPPDLLAEVETRLADLPENPLASG